MVTKQQLLAFDANLAPYVDGILLLADKYKINTPLRMAHFLAQCAHESGDFRLTKENLNYGAQGLANTWPGRFAQNPDSKPYTPNAKAKAIERKPEQIANSVYADRMGNGSEASGDGAKFAGRGLIQLTGRDKYTAYSKFQYGDDRVVKNPEILTKSPDAVLSAAWFWSIFNNINVLADKDDVVAVTKRVNGGTIGLEERKAKLAKAKKAFGI